MAGGRCRRGWAGRPGIWGRWWWRGRTEPGRLRPAAVTANGQRSFAVYQRGPGGAYHAHAVLVPTVTAAGIARIVAFQDPGLFGSFGLPRHYRAAALVPAQGQAAGPVAGLRGR